MKTIPSLVVILFLCLPSYAQEPDWQLYPADCEGGSATVEFACGSYGRFLVGDVVAPDCEDGVAGEGEAPRYAPANVPATFPIVAKRLREIRPPTAPAPLSLKLGTTQPKEPMRWIAVIDFNGAHGDSTAWLAGRVGGASVTTALAPLDDPAFASFEGVGDLNLLARLCEILDAVDDNHLPPPAVINMSFGRLRQGENPNPDACTPSRATCQVAKVARRLKDKGSFLVAAAGNHGDVLFPASLDDVIGAGMLDTTWFAEKGYVRPAWETALPPEAVIPGHPLCLGGWPAPAGSSYSSALLSGWLVEVVRHPSLRQLLSSGTWMPAWHDGHQQYVLARGTKLTPWPNAAVTEILAGIRGQVATACTADPGTLVTGATGLRAVVPEIIPSVDVRHTPAHPTPESDPCVPCTGVIVDNGLDEGDLVLDLSRSGPLPDDLAFDEVFVRVDGLYHPLGLTEAQLELMRLGDLATIVVPGAAGFLDPNASLSLWYRLRDGGGECTALTCWWSSTPLLVKFP